MKVTVDETAVQTVERNITPPLGQAVTLPVKFDGQLRHGVVIYVAQSGFAPQIPQRHIQSLAAQVAILINHHELEAHV